MMAAGDSEVKTRWPLSAATAQHVHIRRWVRLLGVQDDGRGCSYLVPALKDYRMAVVLGGCGISL